MNARLTLPLFALAAAGQGLASPINPLLADKYSLIDRESPVSGHRVSAGVIVNDRDSFKLGEYTGLHEDRSYGLGAFFSGGQWADSEITYRVEGSDLGLDSRQILGNFSFAGGIRLDVAYRELPHYELDSVFTPFGESGGNRWLLSDDWIGAGSVGGFASLDSALRETDTHTKRKRMEAGLLWPLDQQWTLRADYSFEEKSGNQLTGVVFGVGGTQMGVRIPSEIDRRTQEMGLSLAYQGSGGTFTVGYRYSDLDEESDPLVVQNPFIRPAFAGAANFPNGFGRLAPAPDNRAHVFYGKGVLRIGRTTRLSLDLQRARHEQDDDFLPYTINDGLATPLALPAPDLDGERIISHARLALTLRPTARTNLTVRYRYHDRDDRTDRRAFAFVLHDVRDQGTDPATGAVRVNRPYSRTTRQLAVEGGYRFTGGWRLSAGLERETVERDLLPVDETEEDAGYLKLNYRLSSDFSGWLQWRRAERDSGRYVSNAAFLAGHTQAFIEANGTDVFVNDPALRAYFLADRSRDRRDWVLNWAASPAVSLAFKFRRTEDDYSDSDFGLTGAESRDLTLDMTYSPRRELNLYGYVSRAWLEQDQAGFQWQGFLPQMTLPPLRDNSANAWEVESTSRSDTFGAGLEWALSSRIDVEVEYARTDSRTDYDIAAGSALTAAPLPDVEMDWRDITARASYRVRDHISLGLQYRFRDYSTRDFALDGVAVDSDPSVLLSGASAPDFRGNTLALSVTYDLQ